jgi:archaellum component FlaC
MTTTATPTWQQAHDALQMLKEQLETALEAATADSVIDALDQRADAVDDALTAMNQQDMASRTVALQAAVADLVKPLKDLDQLKTDLADIGNDTKKAAAALAQVDKIVSSVKSCFGLPI